MFQKFINRLFNRAKYKQTGINSIDAMPIDISKLTGSDFEFLITPGGIEIKAEDFDNYHDP